MRIHCIVCTQYYAGLMAGTVMYRGSHSNGEHNTCDTSVFLEVGKV